MFVHIDLVGVSAVDLWCRLLWFSFSFAPFVSSSTSAVSRTGNTFIAGLRTERELNILGSRLMLGKPTLRSVETLWALNSYILYAAVAFPLCEWFCSFLSADFHCISWFSQAYQICATCLRAGSGITTVGPSIPLWSHFEAGGYFCFL